MINKKNNNYLLAIIIFIVYILLETSISMWLWNIILVPLFNAPIIGYWQMCGIIVLVRLIFGKISISS